MIQQLDQCAITKPVFPDLKNALQTITQATIESTRDTSESSIFVAGLDSLAGVS